MPGKLTVKIEGVAELERAMKEFGPRFTNNVSGRALRAMAKPIVQRAKALVPVDTGLLKKSITTKLHRVRKGQRTINVMFVRLARAVLSCFGQPGLVHDVRDRFRP
jgi:Bacteriophage HK97-gp10, putative tail-component